MKNTNTWGWSDSENSESENDFSEVKIENTCNYCGNTFSNNKTFQEHKNKCEHKRDLEKVLTADGTKKYLCKICAQGFKYVSGLTKHEKRHEPPGGFICRLCKSTFISDYKRTLHKESVHKVFKCHICEIKFFNEKEYFDHINLLHDGKDRIYVVCSKCGHQFRTPMQLKNHNLSRCGTHKAFTCNECGSKFMTQTTLYVHKLRHTGVKKHLCNYCGNSFLSKGQLKVHERRHTKEKPFICNICKKSFSHRESLVTHSSLHTGIKAYQCECCCLRFSCIGNLIKHRKCRPFSCGLPQYKTNNKIAPRATNKTLRQMKEQITEVEKQNEEEVIIPHSSDLLIMKETHNESENQSQEIILETKDLNQTEIDSHIDENIAIEFSDLPNDIEIQYEIPTDDLNTEYSQYQDSNGYICYVKKSDIEIIESQQSSYTETEEEWLQEDNIEIENTEIKLEDNKTFLYEENEQSYNLIIEQPIRGEIYTLIEIDEDKLKNNNKLCIELPPSEEFIPSTQIIDLQNEVTNNIKDDPLQLISTIPTNLNDIKTENDNFSDEDNLKDEDDDDNKKFSCEICKKTYLTLKKLKKHLKLHGDNGNLTIKCKYCNHHVSNKDDLEEHEKQNHLTKLFCNECQSELLKDPNANIKCKHKRPQNKITESFICSNCGKKFASKMALGNHEQSKCGEKPPHKCNVCNKSYNTLASLKIHASVHTGDKPHLCKFCGKAFRTLGQVKIHERQHSGEKPFKCPHCPKSFGYRESLLTHISLHTGFKRFVCQTCNERFSCISNLQTHRRSKKRPCSGQPINTKPVENIKCARGQVYYDK